MVLNHLGSSDMIRSMAQNVIVIAKPIIAGPARRRMDTTVLAAASGVSLSWPRLRFRKKRESSVQKPKYTTNRIAKNVVFRYPILLWSSWLLFIASASAHRYITGLPMISGNTTGRDNRASTGALAAISSATRRITVLQCEFTMF